MNTKWKGIVQNMQIFYNKFHKNTIVVATQLINMAWGFKEVTNEHNNDIIIWLDKYY